MAGALAVFGSGLALRAQCPPADDSHHSYLRSDALSLQVESAAGAVGDVVGVTVSMRSAVVNPGQLDMFLAVCHDPAVAELVGKPIYTDEFAELTGGINLHTVEEGGPFDQVGHGFLLDIDLTPWGYNARFPSDVPLTLMTIYYRIKGNPGDTGLVSFCDGVLARGMVRCTFNELYGYPDSAITYTHYLLAENSSGKLTVLEGPATHPDRPPEPPEAKIYPELPSPEAIDFRVRVDGTRARPGSVEVPVEVYVSAAVEYSSIVIPVDFDERYLRLARAEDHFLTGITLVNNRDDLPGAGPEEGNVVIYSGLGVNSHRIAAEGEEVHAATLYFNVLPAAAEIASTSLSVVTVTDERGLTYRPWIYVHHRLSVGTSDPPIRSQIAPLTITNGAVTIIPELILFVRGDSNDDRLLDLSDAQTTLSYLFLGGRAPFCLDAADTDDNGRLDVADPIALLQVLFLGSGSIPPPSGPGEDPTPDSLGCF